MVLRLDASFFYLRGWYRIRGRNYEGALHDLNRVIKLKPKYGEAYCNRAYVHWAKGQFDEASLDFSAAVAILGEKSRYGRWALLLMPLAKFYKGDKSEDALNDAAQALESIFKNAPNNPDLYAYRGWLYLLAGFSEKSISDCTRAIELNPRLAGAYGTRGSARYSAGDQGAIVDFRKAVELWGHDTAGYYYNQGFLHFIDGEYQKAIKAWEKAVEMEASWNTVLGSWMQKAREK